MILLQTDNLKGDLAIVLLVSVELNEQKNQEDLIAKINQKLGIESKVIDKIIN